MLRSPVRLILSLCLVLGILLAPGSLRSQESEPAVKKSAKKNGSAAKRKAPAAETSPGDTDEWARLIERRNAIVKEIEAIQQQSVKDVQRRAELVAQFRKLAGEFRTIQSRIIELAPGVLEKDPEDVIAAEVVAGKTLMENQYEQVIALVSRIREAGKATAPLLNLLGIAQFAVHDFEGAQQTLAEAEQADPKLFVQMGGAYQEAASNYVDFWKQEQDIRSREEEADDLPRVVLKTSRGDIVLELFENEAPNTVANFVSLVESKKYNGTVFHRVEPNFVAQGGNVATADSDPDNDNEDLLGYTIPCECYTEKARRHFQGSLSMAHAGKDTGDSQFFLTFRPTPHLNWEPGKEENNHTVFGRIVEGLDVALALKVGDKLESATVLRKRDHAYKPKKLAEQPQKGFGGTPRLKFKKRDDSKKKDE